MIDRRDLFLKAGAASLLGLASGAAGSALGASDRGAARIAADLAELAAAPPGNLAMIVNGAIYIWATGNFRIAPLGPADGVTIVKQDDTPLAAGAWVRQSGVLSVEAFGAIGGTRGSPAVNTAAFNSAIAASAGLGVPLHLEGGSYRLDASGAKSGGVNFARAGLHVRGDGATLIFEGPGRAFVLDQGGQPGDVIEGVSIADLTIIGGRNVTDGFYMRGVVRSVFRNIAVLDVTGKAFWIKHGVSCHFDSLKYSALRPGERVPPISATHGLYIDNNDGPGPRRGYYSADCVFTNAIMEGFPGVGCHIADGSGHVFVGGTFEACRIGLTIDRRSQENVFLRLWMEANAVADAVIDADMNGFLGPKFMSSSQPGPNVRIMPGVKGTWFAGGGYVRHIDMAAGSTGTSFHQVGVDENRSGTIGFQGAGSYTRIGCMKIGPDNNVVGAYGDIVGPLDALGAAGTWTPALAPGQGVIVASRSSSGTFHKLGRLVVAQCTIVVDRVASPKGALSIAGLPFAAAAPCAGSIHASPWNGTTGPIQVRMEANSATLSVSRLSADVAADVAGAVRAGTAITVAITYPIAG